MLDILLEFLSFPLSNSEAILDKFASLPGAVRRGRGDAQFVFVKGIRADRALLVAHADTVWGMGDRCEAKEFELQHKDGIIKNLYGGLGADDRAGCAMAWLLRDMGHSILITNGEEYGGIGSAWLMEHNPDIRAEINDNCSFAVELDRRNARDFKCYSVGTDEFRSYVKENTGYSEPNRHSFTDIVAICKKICGVNLSVGYYNEHSDREYLVFAEWQNTLNVCKQWLSKSLPKFSLKREDDNDV